MTDAYDYGGGNRYRRNATHGGWLAMDAEHFGGSSEYTELVVNGDFDDASAWEFYPEGALLIAGGVATMNLMQFIQQVIELVSGHHLKLSYTFVQDEGDTIQPFAGNWGGTPQANSGTYEQDLICTVGGEGNVGFYSYNETGLIGTLDDVSLKDYGMVGDGSPVSINGTFSDATDWTLGADWAVTGGKLTGTATNGGCTYDNLFPAGFYKVTFTIEVTSGGVSVGIGIFENSSILSSGTYTKYCESVGEGSSLVVTSVDFTGTVDNITVEDITP